MSTHWSAAHLAAACAVGAGGARSTCAYGQFSVLPLCKIWVGCALDRLEGLYEGIRSPAGDIVEQRGRIVMRAEQRLIDMTLVPLRGLRCPRLRLNKRCDGRSSEEN
jgi:hypothetical protein